MPRRGRQAEDPGPCPDAIAQAKIAAEVVCQQYPSAAAQGIACPPPESTPTPTTTSTPTATATLAPCGNTFWPTCNGTCPVDRTKELRKGCPARRSERWVALETREREQVDLAEVEFTPGNWSRDAVPLRYVAVRFTPRQSERFAAEGG